MKELSIEEKAKAYDEALARAKKLCEYPTTQPFVSTLEEIFPELAESEDERIRKEILSFCQNRADNYPNDPKYANIGNWISWLEKQGGEKDNLSIDFVLGYLGIKPAYKDGNAWCILLGDNIQEGICGFGDTKEEALIAFMKELIEKQGEHANFLSKIQVGDKVTRNEAGILVNLSQLKRVAKPREKQGEQKASYTTIVETGDGGINALVTRELPTDGCDDEQKPADEIEEAMQEVEEKAKVFSESHKGENSEQILAEMCKHYDKASHSGLRDFYDNVKVKCKDAKEYDSIKEENI